MSAMGYWLVTPDPSVPDAGDPNGWDYLLLALFIVLVVGIIYKLN